MEFVCSSCDYRHRGADAPWRCPRCGGAFDLRLEVDLRRHAIEAGPPDLWRYAGALPPVPPEARVSLGEPVTPLVESTWAGVPVRFKLDYLFPTGSYKDRGNAVFVSVLRAAGVSAVVEDSSGNAGASLAAYCARAGIRCTIYAPADTSPAKLVQIRAYRAEVVAVPGSRADTARAVQAAAKRTYYASHNWNPIFLHAMKTLAFETCEQLRWRAPAAVVMPCGYGSVVLGAYLGFQDLMSAGLIDRLPRLVAVQAAACAPLYAAYRAEAGTSASSGHTLAEGIACAEPIRPERILEAIRASGGEVIAVSEGEILDGLRALAAQGLYVEPTSAVVAAAMSRLAGEGRLEPGTVAVLTGSGLKATEKLVKVLAAGT